MSTQVFSSSKWVRIVPASGKIYDITHADTNEHSVALPAGYPANTKAIIIRGVRVTGTGSFIMISTSGQSAYSWNFSQGGSGVWMRAADGLFYYSLSVANDDWDIHAIGYVTA